MRFAEHTILKVLICDAANNPCDTFKTKDTLRIIVDFDNDCLNKGANLSVTFFDTDGRYIFGTATLYDKFTLVSSQLVFEIAELLLMRGIYEISIGLWDSFCNIPFDLHERRYRISVNSPNHKDEGLVFFEHSWNCT